MPRRTKRITPFTMVRIEGLPTPKTGRVEWWDEDTPSLSCRITAAGGRSFYWVGRTAGKWVRTMIGPFPQTSVGAARSEARRLSAEAIRGKQVRAASRIRARELKLGELFEWYMEAHSRPHKKTWEWDQRLYELKLQHWSDWLVSTITKADVAKHHLLVEEKSGPYAANEMLQMLRHMYRWGADLDPQKVPCPEPTRGIKRFHEVERERFLDADELPRFLEAVKTLQNEVSQDFLLLALYTGARRSNVCGMRWEHLSLETGIWIIPGDEAKKAKPINVVLTPQALEVLRRRKLNAAEGSPWVLPGRSGAGHYLYPKEAMKQVCARAGLKDVRVHDLRRTLGSWMAVGSPLQVVGKQLGHTSLAATKIYARLANKTQIDAVSKATNAMAKAAKQNQTENAAKKTTKAKPKPRK